MNLTWHDPDSWELFFFCSASCFCAFCIQKLFFFSSAFHTLHLSALQKMQRNAERHSTMQNSAFSVDKRIRPWILCTLLRTCAKMFSQNVEVGVGVIALAENCTGHCLHRHTSDTLVCVNKTGWDKSRVRNVTCFATTSHHTAHQPLELSRRFPLSHVKNAGSAVSIPAAVYTLGRRQLQN